MAFEDDLEPDWIHEAPFFLTAAVVYAGALMFNPVVQWGARPPAEKSVPIDFVAQLPAPSPNLAPSQGVSETAAPPRKGEGEYKPESVKEGAVDAPPKPLPKPKPAAAPAPRKKPAASMVKPKPAAKPRAAVNVQAILQQSMARRVKLDQDKAAKAASAALAAQQAAEAKAAAQAAAQAAAAEKARRLAAAREAAARRAALAQAAADRKAAEARAAARALAAANAAKARKKAELSQQLATMNDPDEALDPGADAAPLAAGTAKTGAGAGAKSARKASAAAALDAAEAPEPGDSAGSGGGDLLDAKATGGGTGPDGEGVSWSLDGPVGSRRVLTRTVPTSPDWVGTRGLDLTVTVRFQVLPDGTVKPGAVIQKTSGFPEIDRRALDALSNWKFETVPDGGAEVWGRVTFRFTS